MHTMFDGESPRRIAETLRAVAKALGMPDVDADEGSAFAKSITQVRTRIDELLAYAREQERRGRVNWRGLL